MPNRLFATRDKSFKPLPAKLLLNKSFFASANRRSIPAHRTAIGLTLLRRTRCVFCMLRTDQRLNSRYLSGSEVQNYALGDCFASSHYRSEHPTKTQDLAK